MQRPVPRFSAILFLLISMASCLSCRACWAISSLATLEVMIKMASLQSMVFPLPSVSLPCNGTRSTQASVGAPGHFQNITAPFSPRDLVLMLSKGHQRTQAGAACDESCGIHWYLLATTGHSPKEQRSQFKAPWAAVAIWDLPRCWARQGQ